MLKKVFEGSVDNLQILDENGGVDVALLPSYLDDAKIVEMYKLMCFARALDAKVLSLQRQGRAATYAPLLGQEATQIGSAMAMRKGDLFVPNFRQHGRFPCERDANRYHGAGLEGLRRGQCRYQKRSEVSRYIYP